MPSHHVHGSDLPLLTAIERRRDFEAADTLICRAGLIHDLLLQPTRPKRSTRIFTRALPDSPGRAAGRVGVSAIDSGLRASAAAPRLSLQTLVDLLGRIRGRPPDPRHLCQTRLIGLRSTLGPPQPTSHNSGHISYVVIVLVCLPVREAAAVCAPAARRLVRQADGTSRYVLWLSISSPARLLAQTSRVRTAGLLAAGVEKAALRA